MREVNILGTRVSILKREELLKLCESALDRRDNLKLFAINPIKVSRGYKNPELREILNGGDINFCDGKGVCWGIKFLYGERVNRIAGFDFLFDILKMAEIKKKSVFFIGNREESISKGVEILRSKFPHVDFMGYINGYFSKEELDNLLERLKKDPPNIIFVGMGAFLQEKWILYIEKRLKSSILMGIGGSIDVISGFSPRAPEFLCEMGFEWLYRLIRQPKRIKVMVHLPLFLFYILKKKFFGGKEDK